MRRNEFVSSEPAPPAQFGPFATVDQAVAALIPHLNDLEHIAERRLRRLACQGPGQRLLARGDPMDYVMEAILLILGGGQNPHRGRQTHPRHLRSLQAFLYYVQNVIRSHISHELGRMGRQGEHLPLGPESPDSPCIDPPAAADVVREVSLRETRWELFIRLRRYTQGRPELMRAVEPWSESWLADGRITHEGLRPKEVHEMRVQARKILGNLAQRDGADCAHGTEVSGP